MARQKSISIPITGNNAPLRKALKDSEKQLTAFGKIQKQWGAATAAAYGVAGSAAFQFAQDSVKAAMEDQKAQALLADQLRKTVGATSTAIAANEDFITQLMLASNVTDDQLRPALAQLVRVTGDTTSAQKLLATAVDVSVGSGRELSSVVVAIGKAAQGQTAGLSKLGITLSEGAASGGDLNAIMSELNAKFGGAAAAAVDTTAGRIENLNVRFGELKEQIGTALLPVVEELSGALLDIAKGVEEQDFGSIAGGVNDLANEINGLINPAKWVANWIGDRLPWNDAGEDVDALRTKYQDLSTVLQKVAGNADLVEQALADAADEEARQQRMVGYMRDDYKQLSEILVQQADDYKKKTTESDKSTKKTTNNTKAERKAYRELADSMRLDLARAVADARKELEDAQKAAKDFGDSFAYSFGVSLAGAYSDAQTSEDSYTDALKSRKDAYDALDVAKQGTDLNAYLKALQDVQTAEAAVTTAQKARISPAAAFAKQVADAKTFGANLKTLIGSPYNLGQAGLQQLLDLGPTAGAQVTSDLISGTAGFSVGDLNASLADLAGVQAGLSSGITATLGGQYNAATAAAQQQVDALSSASISAPGVGQGMQIVIQTGVGDPVAIGAQVKSVLTSYDQRAGKLTVQGPKKKAKKK
jgi:hypothetical protein